MEISNAVPQNLIYVTAGEGEKIINILSRVRNTEVEDVVCSYGQGEEIDLSDTRAKAVYSDGSISYKRVEWNQDQIEAINTGIPSTYTVDGTVIRSEYPFPMMSCRADPNIVYYNGIYYFIALLITIFI